MNTKTIVEVFIGVALLLEQGGATWPLASRRRSAEGQERAAVAILYPQHGGKTLHFSKHFLLTLECVHLGLNITQLRLVANRGPRSLSHAVTLLYKVLFESPDVHLSFL